MAKYIVYSLEQSTGKATPPGQQCPGFLFHTETEEGNADEKLPTHLKIAYGSDNHGKLAGWQFGAIGVTGEVPPDSPYAAHEFGDEELDALTGPEGEEELPVQCPAAFDYLCLFYDNEGGARINVTAIDRDANTIIRPVTGNAADQPPGTDPRCPIALCRIAGKDQSPTLFHWEAGQRYKLKIPAALYGAWTTEAITGVGLIELQARAHLPADAKDQHYTFDGWWYHPLVPSKADPLTTDAQHDAIGADSGIYGGFAAYYKLTAKKPGWQDIPPVTWHTVVIDPHWREPQYKPGPISIPDPPIKGWLARIAAGVRGLLGRQG